jgi:hypothetical protein
MPGSSRLNAGKIEAARRGGRIALARVLSIRRTGTTINDEPVCVIEVLVAPEAGRPYRTSVREVVSIVELPAMQPGAVLVVAQLAADRPEVAIIKDPEPGWWHRAEVDQRIRSLPTAELWDPPARGGDAYGRLRIPRVVFLALAVGAAAVTMVPAYPQIAWQLRGETMLKGNNAAQAIKAIELSRRVITEAKRTPERAWLGEVSAVVLQQALALACAQPVVEHHPGAPERPRQRLALGGRRIDTTRAAPGPGRAPAPRRRAPRG